MIVRKNEGDNLFSVTGGCWQPPKIATENSINRCGKLMISFQNIRNTGYEQV
jgi:hypothetical protein